MWFGTLQRGHVSLLGRRPCCGRWCLRDHPARRSKMPKPSYRTALIVGAGRGLRASLARLFTPEGLRVALAARDTEKLAPLCAETGAKAFACDAVQPEQVARLFEAVEAAAGAPDVVVFNAHAT